MKPVDASNSISLPKPKVTFRLLHQHEIALGPGKAELLQAIDQTGSISAAGKSMNMSYRRAWMLVDVMNRCFKQPLVQTAKGGKDGGVHGFEPVLDMEGRHPPALCKTCSQAKFRLNIMVNLGD